MLRFVTGQVDASRLASIEGCQGQAQLLLPSCHRHLLSRLLMGAKGSSSACTQVQQTLKRHNEQLH